MTPSRPEESVYTGSVGKTQSRFAIYNCRCGSRFAMEVFTSIDVAERADLVQMLLAGGLNRGQCGSCGAPIAVDTRCVLHDPVARRLILYLPERERHAEIEARANLLMDLAKDPSSGLPGYAINFEVAFGAEGLHAALMRRPAPEIDRRAHEIEEAERRLAEREEEMARREAALVERAAEIDRKFEEVDSRLREMEGMRVEMGRQAADLEVRRREVEEFSQKLEMRGSAFRVADTRGRFPSETGPGAPGFFPAKPDASPLEASIKQALPPYDEDEPETPRPVSDRDVVDESAIVSEEAIVEERPLAASAPAIAHAPGAAAPRTGGRPGKVDDEVLDALSRPERRHARIVGDQVDLFAVTNDASLLEDVKRSSVRFRVHFVEGADGYPWALLSAAVRPPGREIYLFKWLLDYQVRLHRRILGRLGEKCEAHITLVSTGLERNVTFIAKNRIEGNVKSIASDLEQFFLEHADVGSPPEPDEAPVIKRLLDELRKPFPFNASYVEDHSSPRGVMKAVADLEEWSHPEGIRKLVRIYSFPLEGLAGIKRRVLARAVEFGIDLPGSMPGEAVGLGLADDDTALLGHSLRAFLDLCRSGHDLAEEEVAQNWKRLVDAAIRRGLALDVEVAEVALDHLNAQGIEAVLPPEVQILEATPIAELGRDVLVRWLYRPTRRAQAAVELLGRQDPSVFPAVSAAVHMMSGADLLEVVPFILSNHEDASEPFFMDGLKSESREQRVASALALGKLKLRSAVVPLINALCEHDEPEWKVESVVLSRFGVAAIRTVEQFLRNPRGCEERLVFLTSALASAGCEKQVRDLASEPDLMVASIARRALDRRMVVDAEVKALLDADTDDPLVLFVRAMDSRLARR